MPEFVPIFEAMVDLAGGGDHAARFLSQYCPPPLFRGCSQAIYDVEESVLVRSYDYSPFVFDGLLMRSRFGERQVIAMLDCMSGVLDGINSDGLAVSMSFGGREEFGEGFGISLLLRYLLEFAGNVSEACELIQRIPVQGAYNIMLLDYEANFETVEIQQQLAALRRKGVYPRALPAFTKPDRGTRTQQLRFYPRISAVSTVSNPLRQGFRYALRCSLLSRAQCLRVFLATQPVGIKLR
jgi:predicted choloylglycine hydrolase